MKILQVSEMTIVRWKKLGMPHMKLGYRMCRFDLEEVMQWVKTKK